MNRLLWLQLVILLNTKVKGSGKSAQVENHTALRIAGQ